MAERPTGHNPSPEQRLTQDMRRHFPNKLQLVQIIVIPIGQLNIEF